MLATLALIREAEQRVARAESLHAALADADGPKYRALRRQRDNEIHRATALLDELKRELRSGSLTRRARFGVKNDQRPSLPEFPAKW